MCPTDTSHPVSSVNLFTEEWTRVCISFLTLQSDEHMANEDRSFSFADIATNAPMSNDSPFCSSYTWQLIPNALTSICGGKKVSGLAARRVTHTYAGPYSLRGIVQQLVRVVEGVVKHCTLSVGLHKGTLTETDPLKMMRRTGVAFLCS